MKKNMYVYLDTDFYVLNGDFIFTIAIDKNRKATNIEGAPNVDNSFDDMKYVVRRIRKNWIPAMCSGKPVTSQVKIKMNLSLIPTEA